ncbi:MAG: hypothetical protein US52_C0025G0009 [candidate division WS6 bacterium GW2011_GWA2_37_6]|uniref:Uncharacterized protein n=1 Tax=candidate division WS6 bacterium GW2011_GWA2_37_6 TaxID=1619087 RepID=A0A0G0K469_9BACT|nr:MAG: hypothetical protein US52_C0025G0009 [candidate division WS6 bacterium GW2011_GWA2_37_6]
MKEDDYKTLLNKVNNIELELKKQRSLRKIIPRAILSGVFVSFGATIIFALVLIVLAKLIQGADQIPILNDIIERTRLEEIIENQKDRPSSLIS